MAGYPSSHWFYHDDDETLGLIELKEIEADLARKPIIKTLYRLNGNWDQPAKAIELI